LAHFTAVPSVLRGRVPGGSCASGTATALIFARPVRFGGAESLRAAGERPAMKVGPEVGFRIAVLI
jgi:hypothetical protein